LEYCHNLFTQGAVEDSKGYEPMEAMLMARLMNDLNRKITEHGASFVQQYLVDKGLKVFGKRGYDASMKEMNQLSRRNCFTPESVCNLSSFDVYASEARRITESAMRI
jgi:hypothetical protein